MQALGRRASSVSHGTAPVRTVSYSSSGGLRGKAGFGDDIEFSVEKSLRDRNG